MQNLLGKNKLLFINPLIGLKKKGDINNKVLKKVFNYLKNLNLYKNKMYYGPVICNMNYAGPREALLHAVFRQNAGCTHLIVGRDHAGVGDYYGPFEAQEIFESDVVKNSLKLKIFSADHTAYSKKLNQVVMMRDVKDHDKDDFVLLSGTKVREMLSNGEELPKEFARKEVAEILMKYYQSL